MKAAAGASLDGIESLYAWRRLAAAVLLGAIGNCGMWTAPVVLPVVQAEFGIDRGAASLPYTAAMVGFGIGSLVMGRLADRVGAFSPALIATLALTIGYILAGLAPSLAWFAAAHGIAIGMLGSSGVFAPLIADISHWFTRRRGMALAICACGNQLAGVVWPPLVQLVIESHGWRYAYFGIGVVCFVTMLPLTLALRRRAPVHDSGLPNMPAAPGAYRSLGLPNSTLQGLLIVAAIACCVAMSMPQVHIVAYCSDLGYGVARGAEMLTLMVGLGVASRLASGWVADRIGGLRTLLLGSVLQALGLILFLPFDGLTSLYVVSGLFGFFQGGIVSSYPIIVREYFPPQQAGMRVGIVLTAALGGMALGGWMTGAIFDLTGSYRAAFFNGIGWNLLNIAIVGWLAWRAGLLVRTRSVIA